MKLNIANGINIYLKIDKTDKSSEGFRLPGTEFQHFILHVNGDGHISVLFS